MIYDQNLTNAEASKEKYAAYHKWLKDCGAHFPKIQYPAVYKYGSGGIIGVACTEEIAPFETIMYIPNQCLMSTATARSSEIAEIYRDNEDLFLANQDRDFVTMVLFIMYERLKGDDGFYHAFFEVAQLVEQPGLWEEDKVNKFQDRELRANLKTFKENAKNEWESLQQIIQKYTPQYFPEGVKTPVHEDEDLYHWAANFLATRNFGWECPYTHLAPMIEACNHAPHSGTDVDLLHTKLHVAENKIYNVGYSDIDYSNPEKPVFKLNDEKDSHRMLYDVKYLYEKLGKATPENEAIITGRNRPVPEPYDEKEILERFKLLYEFENSNSSLQVKAGLIDKGTASEESYEEAKREYLVSKAAPGAPVHGIQLWGLGHLYDYSPVRRQPLYQGGDSDVDEREDGEEDEEEAREAFNLAEKILSDDAALAENLEPEELETIAASPLLKQAYNNRWYRHGSHETYFLLSNMGPNAIKPGEQIFFTYGRRSNAYLVENYGFTLDHTNFYSHLPIRAVLATNPKQKIKSAKELLPDKKMLEDEETSVYDVTEVLKVKYNKVSPELLSFLRSVLMESTYEGDDKKYLMVSSPRVIDFELMVLKFGVELLEEHGKTYFSDAVQNQEMERDLASSDDSLRLIAQYNSTLQLTWKKAIKLMQVLQAILLKIRDEKEPFTSACFKKIEGLEDNDSVEEIYERRMGMQQYFKELRMGLQRIEKKKSKFSEDDIKKAKKQTTGKKPPTKAAVGSTPKKEEKKVDKMSESTMSKASATTASSGKTAGAAKPAAAKKADIGAKAAAPKRSGSKTAAKRAPSKTKK